MVSAACKCLGKMSNMVAHDMLKLAGAQLALLVAQGPVLREACEVRRRDMDPGSEVLAKSSRSSSIHHG